MKLFLKAARDTASYGWWYLRQIFGDAAYENYLRSLNRAEDQIHPGAPSTPLSPSEFYVDSLRRRYSRISRCC